MTIEEKQIIFDKANNYLKNVNWGTNLVAIETSLQEHQFCCSLSWCEKEYLEKTPIQPVTYVGVGRILVSKINDKVAFEGSAPIDWIRRFELNIQNIEEYWELEISFEKKNIGKLKRLLGYNTIELMKQVNPNAKIIIESDEELEQLKYQLDKTQIENKMTLKTRKKTV